MLAEYALPRTEKGGRKKVMICHTFRLEHGDNTLCHYNILGTIKRCLALEVTIFIDHQQLDPLKETYYQKFQHDENVLSEVKRLQSILNHKEPVTVKMES